MVKHVMIIVASDNMAEKTRCSGFVGCQNRERGKCGVRYNKGVPFKLWNGLPATVYRLKSPTLRLVVKACKKIVQAGSISVASPLNEQYVLAVEVEKETIYLIYYGQDPPRKLIRSLENSDRALASFFVVVYSGLAYSFLHYVAEKLKNAIRYNINPKISLLIE
jgi:hypothetical protein